MQLSRRLLSHLGTHFLLLLLLSVTGCAHQQRPTIPVEYQAFADELRKDFPFRAGMTTAAVKKLFRENNERVEKIMHEEFRKNRESGVMLPPAFADRERHLYLYVDTLEGMPAKTENSLSFWVNGRTQFWVDMAIEDHKVRNIFITPGNGSVLLPSFCFDGTGKHVGWFAQHAHQANGARRKLNDAAYTGNALEHEVLMAKLMWMRESYIATRIAQLRSDDSMRRGIRREWIGPTWVKDRVGTEDSKYFERIWAVYLGGTDVTNEDVLEVSRLTELRELYLHSTDVTDAALKQICSLQKIRVLHLRNTRISDAGVETLSCLTSLRNLYLHECGISDAVGMRLRSELPNAKIEW